MALRCFSSVALLGGVRNRNPATGIVDQKVMPLEAIPRHIGLAAGDVEALAGLPEGYFQGKTNVVEFARLKAPQKQVDDQPARGNKVVPFRPVSKS